MPLLVSSVLLFYAGVVFAYFVVFPVMFNFFVGTVPIGVKYMPDMASYLDFVLTMFFAFGVAFEVPVAVVLLVLTGLVKVEKLAENRGYVIIGIFVVAAFLTPPDAISQIIMAMPMWLLYEGGLVMARVMQKMRREAAEAARRKKPRRAERSAGRERQPDSVTGAFPVPAAAPCWRYAPWFRLRPHRGATAPIKIRGITND